MTYIDFVRHEIKQYPIETEIDAWEITNKMTKRFGISRAHARQLTLANLDRCIDYKYVPGLRKKKAGIYYKISRETAQKEHEEFLKWSGMDPDKYPLTFW